ncbi:LysR family transcriptional regulator [Streptomyces spinoverrucosus]|uniref:LysR family transcriptional regulator n=1 Tax=Streptomyces spinoverrucosus TaxID=284043 RepID=UPI0018C41495|nr:LysR family transcriptional regulator [Streptomyces spinoverrucosus]MBG0853190.1 LysR family transcriptional regulator [Streptomyces spinoverrucosus]
MADAGSLTRAATALGLAQPALSAQLKRIERALGGALFERGRHGVRATALGELVLERTRVVLPAVTELQQEAARFARTPRATACLRLGGTHGPLLGALVDRLDPVFVMVPEGHALAAAHEVALAELAAEEWACVPGDGCFGNCFTASCARAGYTPRRMYETDTSSVVHLVQVGRAVGLCRATFPTTPGIVTRPLRGTPLTWRHLLGRHAVAQYTDKTDNAATAATVLAQARRAHAGVAARSDSYTQWLAARRVP